MVAIGYFYEALLWEFLFVLLTLYSLVEICISRSPRIKPKIKSLQKILYPCCLVTGCIGVIMGIDLRGAFGIYRAYPRFPRVTLEVMGIIPTITWGNFWMQQLCQSVFKASNYEGPFEIGRRPALQKLVVIFTAFFWILALLISCALMVTFNQLKYGLSCGPWVLLNG
jgi:Na+/glutamate symporter